MTDVVREGERKRERERESARERERERERERKREREGCNRFVSVRDHSVYNSVNGPMQKSNRETRK